MSYRSRMPAWKTERARHYRENPTLAEARIWYRVRLCQLDCLRFRRQAPMLGWIVDFYCPAARLVIEIDGAYHDPELDDHRDAAMERKGFYVLRFTNDQVFERLDWVLDTIKRRANSRIQSGLGYGSSVKATMRRRALL